MAGQLSAFGCKKIREQLRAGNLVDAIVNFRSVMGLRMIEDARARQHATRFWIAGTEIKTFDTCVANGARAHRARL